ncbi:MAG TPA: metallophosphoesterase, partial [Lacipirellulaceae bacterium]|nr:metallophosphoesterase [Lacipirellulaceae bacterium]
MLRVVLRTLSIVCLVLLRASGGAAHSGPDPIAHWHFTPATVRGGEVAARLGPNATIIGEPPLVADDLGTALRLDGVNDHLVVAPSGAGEALPRKHLTIAAWATVDAGQPHGALVSTLEKDGEGERGWLLGYDDRVFRFVLSTHGSDDGNGRATTIQGTTEFEPGRYYHVVATYDGQEMRLYVNGRLEAHSRQQEGPIYQSRYASYTLGAQIDHDERYTHRGLLRDIAIYDLAASAKWVAHEFDHYRQLTSAKPQPLSDEMQFMVTPYLQFVTKHQITVMWETSRPASGTVRFGETGVLDRKQIGHGEATIHEITLENLEPETPYYYQVEAVDDRGRTIRSPLLSFQTAGHEPTPFAFGVMADMQYNPRVCKILSDMLWMQRPNFVIVPGDLVDRGPVKEHWTEHFFPGMQPLI